MAEKLFGTDGIRGTVNKGAIRPDMFLRFGEALGYTLCKAGDRPVVVIGRDTRASGLILQSAIVSGLLNAGADVALLDVLPTPALGWLTVQNGATAGLMITASHNPFHDNGVKVFGPDGYKLSGAQQDEIEAIIQDTGFDCTVPAERFGRLVDAEFDVSSYADFAVRTAGPDLSLGGLKVVIDAANGAGVSAAEPIFRSLGAEVMMLADKPDGVNINSKCGALHPEGLSEAVRAHSAQIGIAFDGDADRILVVDENGEVADGDQIMGAVALDAKAQGRLTGDTVVATIMSNLGLEGALSREGIKLERTKVGDRYVVERLREGGFSIGGEQSGHVVLADHVTTGDAIIAAIAVLSIMVRESKKASEVLSVFEPVPQLLENVRYQSDDPLSDESVKARIESVSESLGDSGRVVVRKSGTEPLIRVMAEAYERKNAERAVSEIIAEIMKADGQ